MLQFNLPTDRVDYLQLVLPASGLGLIAEWGSGHTEFTAAIWNAPDSPPNWQLTDRRLNLSPDGEWVSVFDQDLGVVRVTQVGAAEPMVSLPRNKQEVNVWTAVAPGGVAVAWKDDPFTVVRALPGGEEIARIKAGWGVDLRFSPGNRWLTEHGSRVFRVFDRANNYKVIGRIKAQRHMLAEVTDGTTAVVLTEKDALSIWDLSQKLPKAKLPVGIFTSALAVSTDGEWILTGNTKGEVILWDATGAKLKEYNWNIKVPIAAAFSRDKLRAAIGGTDGKVVVWDLDS
jgi:WD40 repeat protein